MSGVTLDAVMGTIRKLPSLPTVVMDLLASLTQEDLDIDVLSKKITTDQVLTAKTLKVANSTFYGMPRQVATVTEAIAVLGFHTIRNLVTTAAMVNNMPASNRGGFDMLHFWRHSIATAVCANAIAMELGEHKSEAYTVGLLHDIGRLVLATQFAVEYDHAMNYRAAHDCSSAVAEEISMGLDHAAVGEALAQHWKFPVAMQQAIGQHHQSATASPLGLVVHLADAIAHALDLSGNEDDLVPPVDIQVFTALALSDAALLRVFKASENDFEAACLVLST